MTTMLANFTSVSCLTEAFISQYSDLILIERKINPRKAEDSKKVINIIK